MNVSECRTSLSIQPRSALVSPSAGRFTEIAADTNILIDEQDIRRFAQTLTHQKLHKVTGFRIRL